ncbi:MAG: ATP-binding protein [Gammaproteobacteria bacterium]|nr:ATP-binding protein [Gammaproteobacteria bacterium]
MALPTAPFESARYIGSVIQVEPATVRVNLPHGAAAISSSHAGHRVGKGEVGEFVVVEGEAHGILGRIAEVRLPDRDRLAVEPASDAHGKPANPVGVVQLLLSVDLLSGEALRGVTMHPRIGQHVFSAHPDLIRHAMENGRSGASEAIVLAHVPGYSTTEVRYSATEMFGRHCAILGATGGGKSWTVAHLLDEVVRHRGKAVLFDATGEYRTLSRRVRHVYLGGRPTGPEDEREFVSFPYRHLVDGDLFAMFQPAGGSQSPTLREALTSLKLVKHKPSLAEDGLLKKANRSKAGYNAAFRQFEAEIRSQGADYDIGLLPAQIEEECVWATNRQQNPDFWGDTNQATLGYCTTLISRIEVEIRSDELAPIFRPGGLKDVTEVLDEFLGAAEESVLRISLEHLPHEHNARELVANGFGRFLLARARAGKFLSGPMVLVVDEAHQFLDRSVGEDANRFRLDSFGLIAKEGRKYGLVTVFSTQRPRDIPEDVLSQMGMFIVHRLVNERDRQVVERACGNLDTAAAAFLPILGQGEALVVGLETPMTMPVQVLRPIDEPESLDVELW